MVYSFVSFDGCLSFWVLREIVSWMLVLLRESVEEGVELLPSFDPRTPLSFFVFADFFFVCWRGWTWALVLDLWCYLLTPFQIWTSLCDFILIVFFLKISVYLNKCLFKHLSQIFALTMVIFTDLFFFFFLGFFFLVILNFFFFFFVGLCL